MKDSTQIEILFSKKNFNNNILNKDTKSKLDFINSIINQVYGLKWKASNSKKKSNFFIFTLNKNFEINNNEICIKNYTNNGESKDYFENDHKLSVKNYINNNNKINIYNEFSVNNNNNKFKINELEQKFNNKNLENITFSNKINEIFKNHKLKKIETPKNGNCLFSSISLHIDINENLIRFQVIDYINNDNDLKEKIKNSLQNETIEEYINRMYKNGEWGGDYEIMTASLKYKKVIIVITNQNFIIFNQNDIIFSKNENIFNDFKDPIIIFYNGENHYEGVIKENIF